MLLLPDIAVFRDAVLASELTASSGTNSLGSLLIGRASDLPFIDAYRLDKPIGDEH